LAVTVSYPVRGREKEKVKEKAKEKEEGRLPPVLGRCKDNQIGGPRGVEGLTVDWLTV
jgi:hypothetical protein